MEEIEAKSYLEDIRALKQHSAWPRFEEQIKLAFSQAAESVSIEKMTPDKEQTLKDACRAYNFILKIEEHAESLMPQVKKVTGRKPIY